MLPFEPSIFIQVNFPFRSILAGSESKDDRVIAVETQLELATAKASEAENLWQDFERKLNLAEQELYRTSEKALISEVRNIWLFSPHVPSK